MYKLTEQQFEKIKKNFGEPYYLNKSGEVKSINQHFWAAAYKIIRKIYWGKYICNIYIEQKTIESKEIIRNWHGEYLLHCNFSKDLYMRMPDELIISELATHILINSRELNLPSLEQFMNENHLKPILRNLYSICKFYENIKGLNKMYILINEQLAKDINNVPAKISKE